VKKFNFRAFTIAGSAVLALACGSSDDNDNGSTPDVIPPPVETCDTNPYLQDCVQATPTPANPTPARPPANPATPANPGPQVDDQAELAKAAALNVLKDQCGACHGANGSNQGGMAYIDDIDKLVETGKIQPLDSENSLIIQRMRKGEMPPAYSGAPPVANAQIDIVAQYIDNEQFWPGAAPVGAGCRDSGQQLNFDDVYTAIAEDLARADDDEAINYRYLTLANRFNAGICDDTAMDRDRQALIKAVNMLSIDAKLTAPEPIDRARMIYRIDLTDYDFDRAISVNGQAFDDVWEAVINFNQFAVEFEGNQADQAKLDSGTTVPVMFADSFIDAAMIGNLYYAIINVDVNATIDDFILNELQIDVDQDILDGDAIRAGTTKSRISRQDRLVERHDIGIRSGAFWQSFDFLDDQNESIFQDPFGFAEGGSEVIFTLPNNLMAFAIADANGVILEDSDILLDTQQNNFRAITSISCSSCHAGGFQPVVDEVGPTSIRNAVALGLNRDEVEQLQDLYLPSAEFQAVVTSDSEQFYQNALNRLQLPIKGGDSVSGIYLQFDRDLSIYEAAGDLGVRPAILERNLTLLDPAVQVLDSSVLDRDDFTTFYVDSLCILSIVLENAPAVAVCDAAAQAILDLAAQ